jgi:hypothetical protein
MFARFRAKKWSDRISEKTSLSIDTQSVTFGNHTLQATFAEAPIRMTLYSFSEGSFRFRVELISPEPYNRFDLCTEPLVITQETLASRLEAEWEGSQLLIGPHQIRVNFSPFAIEFCHNTVPILAVNQNEQLLFSTTDHTVGADFTIL